MEQGRRGWTTRKGAGSWFPTQGKGKGEGKGKEEEGKEEEGKEGEGKEDEGRRGPIVRAGIIIYICVYVYVYVYVYVCDNQVECEKTIERPVM